jgi:hypothetical protein
MALGYEGLVSLNVANITDYGLCTGTSFPRQRNRLDSNSGYGGQIKSPVEEIGIGFPRDYDWDTYDGSIDVEVHEDFFVNQIKPWLFDRQRAATLSISSRKDNLQSFSSNAYWSSISLEASADSAVSSSINFVAINRSTYTIGGDYTKNVRGDDIFCAGGSEGFAAPLNPSADNLNPIPYWNTTITIDGTPVEFISWSINFNQEVVKFFACEGDGTGSITEAVEPKFVAVGPMTATFSGEYFFVDTSIFTIPDDISTLSAKLGNEMLSLTELELETASDDIGGLESLSPISVNYSIYGLAGATGAGSL